MLRRLQLLILLTIISYLLSIIGIACILYARIQLAHLFADITTHLDAYLNVDTLFYFKEQIALNHVQIVGEIQLIVAVICYLIARIILVEIAGDDKRNVRSIALSIKVLPLIVIAEILLGYIAYLLLK